MTREAHPREFGPGLTLVQVDALIVRMSEALRARRYSGRTEQAYVGWVRRFLRFHVRRPPGETGLVEVNASLNRLATIARVSASTQNQAASALSFFHEHVLGVELGPLKGMVRARRGKRLPVVLDRSEVKEILGRLEMPYRLVALLLYGSGLRLHEALGLRVHDLEMERFEVLVREGKGGHDRVTMVAEAARPAIERWIGRIRRLHERDVAREAGWVDLPDALRHKYPNAGREFGWQWLFPGSRLRRLTFGERGRHPLHDSAVQRSVKEAVRLSGISKPATCHTFRHSFATHLLQDGCDIRTIQELLGHKSVRTTMIYTHVLNQGGLGIKSPLDRL